MTPNYATITWDLTGGLEQYGNIKGFQRYSNRKNTYDRQEYFYVTQNITVKAEQAYGSYDIATGDLSDSTTDTLGKYEFNLTGATTSTQSIKVGDKFTNYGDKHYYTLTISDNGTTEDTTDDKLVLSVTDCGVSVDDSMTGKWFKKDEDITITGTYFSDSNVSSITFGGNTATLDAVAKTWSYTFASHDDTTGTEYDVVITSANSSYTAKYTLLVDAAAPSVANVAFAGDTKYVDGNGKTWFKQDDSTAKLGADITDATSGLDAVTYNGVTYDATNKQFVLDTAAETDVAAQAIQASDVAGNANNTVNVGAYGVDGTGPVIAVNGADSFSGFSKYVDGTGSVWFKKDDATATLTVHIIDERSGLKNAEYNGVAYADGTFALATNVETGISATIKATDNVGNESQSASIAYNVDGTSVAVGEFGVSGDSVYKTDAGIWVKAGVDFTVGATVADALSGVKDDTVSLNGRTLTRGANDLFSGVYNVTDESDITAWDFSASDNVGNEYSAEAVVGIGVDGTEPSIGKAAISGTNVYQSWIKTGTAFAITTDITDARSGLKSAVLEGTAYAEGKFELTAGADSELADHTISAVDNVGNTSFAMVNYGFDGNGPAISGIDANSFSGTTKYVDGTGSVWFQQDDATATLTVDITDAKSGLKNAEYAGIAYADGTFALATDVDTGISATIKATDNVGNESLSASIAYHVDGTGPSISVSHVVDLPEYTDEVTVTAVITDGAGSGVKTQQYSFDGTTWYDYTGSFKVTENGVITFKAVDNVGNETVQTHEVKNIDPIPPVVTITADTTELHESITFTVNATDEQYTTVTKVEYSIDGGETWTECEIEQGQKSVDVALTADVNNTTYLFRAYDKAKNVCEPVSVTFNNIYKGSETAFDVIGRKTVMPELPMEAQTVTFAGNATLEVAENAEVDVRTIVLNGDDTLQNGGAVTASVMEVHDTGNSIDGNLARIRNITLDEGAELEVNKNQIDWFLTRASFTTDDGKLIVSESDGNLLETDDVDHVMAKANLSNVEFQQDLVGINKLNFTSTKAAAIGFQNGYGTAKNDSIHFYKNTDITLGSEEGVIDLAEGSNTVQIDKNAQTTVKSKLANVSTVKADAGSVVTIADVDFQDGCNATLKASGTSFKAGDINGAEDKATSITTGNGTLFQAGGIALGDRNDKITIGKTGAFVADEIAFGAGKDKLSVGARSAVAIDGNVAGVYTLTVANGSYDKKTDTTSWTKFEISDGALSGTDKSDSLSFGSYADVDIEKAIAMDDGNDTLKLGSYSTLDAGSISDVETISLGSYSQTKLEGGIEGARKLSVGNGKSGLFASLEAAEVTGTAAGDSFTFGNYADVDLTSLDLGDGNDSLKIGNYADVDIVSLDFGDGINDKLTIGKGATLSVDSLNVDSLDTLSMGTDSHLVIADAGDLAAAQDKWSRYSGQIVAAWTPEAC